MRNPTATGMRQTLDRRSLRIPISRNVQAADLGLKMPFPPDFLLYEPDRTRSRVADMWETQFIPTMANLIRTKKGFGMNKHMRQTVFRRGMEKLMIRFNQFTENIKVEFREDIGHKAVYYVDLFRLSPIPDSIRFAPSCAAEVPEPAARAQASESSTTECVAVGEIVEEATETRPQTQYARSATIPAAPTAPLEDIPIAMATAIGTVPTSRSSNSERSSNSASFSGVPEIDLLRREVNELRLRNALLRSQLEASNDARSITSDSNSTSPEVLELRREMEDIRHMMSQMMAMSQQQQVQQMGSTDEIIDEHDDDGA